MSSLNYKVFKGDNIEFLKYVYIFLIIRKNI